MTRKKSEPQEDYPDEEIGGEDTPETLHDALETANEPDADAVVEGERAEDSAEEENADSGLADDDSASEEEAEGEVEDDDDYDPLAEEEEEDEDAEYLGKNTPANARGSDNSASNRGKARNFKVALDDFEDDELKDGPRVDAGPYAMICSAVDFGESHSGNDQFIFEFKITQGKFKNKSYKLYAGISKEQRWKYINTMKALGVNTKKGMETFNEKDVIGKVVVGIVVHEKDNREGYQDEVRDKLARVKFPTPKAVQIAKGSGVV